MSLLDDPPHAAIVQPRRTTTSAAGDFPLVNAGNPVRVRCAMQPVREWSAAEEILVGGIQMLSLLRAISRDWVGDTNALAFYNAYKWEVVGDPEHMGMSQTTAHWEVTLRRVGEWTSGDFDYTTLDAKGLRMLAGWLNSLAVLHETQDWTEVVVPIDATDEEALAIIQTALGV